MPRPKGCKNKRSVLVEQIAQRFPLDPFEILMMVAHGDWKGLGYASETKTVVGKSGSYEVDVIPIEQRTQAAKEATAYLHSKKQSITHSTEGEGFKVIVEEYK